MAIVDPYKIKNDPLISASPSTISYSQQDALNTNNNTNYRKSSNAVKLLPQVSNNNGKIKLYTEVNSNIDVGDNVFIMYDVFNNRTRIFISGQQDSINEKFTFSNPPSTDGAQYFLYINSVSSTGFTTDNTSIKIYPPPSSTDIIEIYYEFIPDIILDNYLEFSGCTTITLNYLNNWQYLSQSQGYEVLEINDSNNEITIDRFFDSKFVSKKIYNHYIGNMYVKFITINKGEIDGAMINEMSLNYTETTNLDINLVQSIVLSGVSSFVDIKNKYDNNYISTNSDILTNNSVSTYKPYSYKGSNISNLDKNTISSYHSKNNNDYGYSYIYNTKIEFNTIYSGYYKNCYINLTKIYGGKFENCEIYNGDIFYGEFINCRVKDVKWFDGIWNDQSNDYTTFDPMGTIWRKGTWNSGIFSGMTWMDGIFNGGTFINSDWENGIFQGGDMISYDIKRYWKNGIFSGGNISNMNWITGSFNGGTMINCNWTDGIFNSGAIKQSNWTYGIFNDGLMDDCNWSSGTTNGGTISKTKWMSGIFNGGTFNSQNNVKFGPNSLGKYDGDDITYTKENVDKFWNGGTFNGGTFSNSIWESGTFNNGTIDGGSLWRIGYFMNGNFNNSYWVDGDFRNGIVNNSSFHSVNWGNGIWNSGNMGIRMVGELTSSIYPVVNWRKGSFNDGIFGHILFNALNKFPPPVWVDTTAPYSWATNVEPGLSASTMRWGGGDFYGKNFRNYYSGCTTQVLGGFYAGTFRGGRFVGTLYGGSWVNGDFDGMSCNQTQIKTPKLNTPPFTSVKKLGRKYGDQPKNINTRTTSR